MIKGRKGMTPQTTSIGKGSRQNERAQRHLMIVMTIIEKGREEQRVRLRKEKGRMIVMMIESRERSQPKRVKTMTMMENLINENSQTMITMESQTDLKMVESSLTMIMTESRTRRNQARK